MTYEHVWPDWLKNYVPKTLSKHTSLTEEIYTDYRNSSVKGWSGDPQSRRLPVVCERCNQGWMKDLQDAVKPILVPLLDAKPTLIGQYNQKLLAAWIAMCIMTGEYYSPDQAAIPFKDREYLRLYREVPRDWRIWIGRYLRGRWNGYWVHHSLPITEDGAKWDNNPPPSPNTQTTTFIVGQLFIHAFSSGVPGITDKWRLDEPGRPFLAQLWPPKESFIAWPTNDISDRAAVEITGYIFWQLDSIARTFGH
jgi:hypothetical protein